MVELFSINLSCNCNYFIVLVHVFASGIIRYIYQHKYTSVKLSGQIQLYLKPQNFRRRIA